MVSPTLQSLVARVERGIGLDHYLAPIGTDAADCLHVPFRSPEVFGLLKQVFRRTALRTRWYNQAGPEPLGHGARRGKDHRVGVVALFRLLAVPNGNPHWTRFTATESSLPPAATGTRRIPEEGADDQDAESHDQCRIRSDPPNDQGHLRRQ